MVFQFSFLKSKKAFSLVELLVTIAILTVLMSIAVVSYRKHLKGTETTFAKLEMTNILKIAKTAWLNDGGYHQFIYAMGYRPPKGKQLATVGTGAGKNAVCCSEYQNCLGKGLQYYDCKTPLTQQPIDNIDICSKTKNCTTNDLLPLPNNFFGISTWCKCDNFIVGGKTLSNKELTLDAKGELHIR